MDNECENWSVSVHPDGKWTIQSQEGGAGRMVAMQYGNDCSPATLADAHRLAAAPELIAACQTVKRFLNKLENGTEDGDPLKAMRQAFHKPLHAALDKALNKAGATI